MRREIDVHAVLAGPDTWRLAPQRPTTRRIAELAADTRLRELTPGTLEWCAARLRRNGGQ